MPPCYCVDSIFHHINIGKMRSTTHSSDIEQKLKSIKSCLPSKPNSSTLLQKVLLSQQNQNNLFDVSSSQSSIHNQPNQTDKNFKETTNNNINNDFHDDFQVISENSNALLTDNSTVCKIPNEVSLNRLSTNVNLSEPVDKLTLPIVCTSSATDHTLSGNNLSSLYGTSHTITKPYINNQLKDNEKKLVVPCDNLKVLSKTDDYNGVKAQMSQLTSVSLPALNTLPKLYSMIANNTGKQDKLSCFLDKPGSILKSNLADKTNVAEKAILTSPMTSSYPLANISSTIIQQTIDESKQFVSSQNESINPVVTLVDVNSRNGESLSVDSFTDTMKHLVPNIGTSQSSQTLLLALPENFNVTQFSNQTLNLDINSQHILRSLLLEPTITSLDNLSKSEEIVGDSVLCIEENFNETSNSNIKDDSENTVNVKSYLDLTEAPSAGIEKISVDKAFNFISNGIPNFNSLLEKEKEIESELKDDSTNKISNVITDVETIASQSLDDSNPLPVATINVDMIDGQPMYTIQIMGQNIPLAAITIPTSDGPLYLQSATSNLQQSQTNTTIDSLTNESPCTYTNANEDTTITTSVSENSSCSTTIKPRYTCEICGKSYIRSWSYYGHLRLHSGDVKRHTCSICQESFAFPSGLKQHMVTHTDEEKGLASKSTRKSQTNGLVDSQSSDKSSFVCSIPDCDKTLGNASALKIHQRVHQEEKPYKCTVDECNKAFKTPSELSRHQFRHTGEKPYKCDKCDKAFVRNDDLKRHYFIHTGQKRFHCDQCDFSCIQSFDLVKHKYIHGGEKPYKCSSCSKQFTRPARLREHERLHTGERPYSCDQCGKSFTQLTSLKSHKIAHGQKPIPCDKCDKMFTNTIELQDHLNSHLGTKPFQCMLCNKTFVSSKTLKRHAIVHTGEKPFECKVCNKKFARSSDLKVHMPVHEEDKPYKCTECSKMFTRYSSLKEHLRLHTGNFPFRCDICNKIFNHRSHLNVHMRTHTGEKPHKCHMCEKEFSRKSNLNLHLRVHGTSVDANNAIGVDNGDDDDGNISDTSVIDDQDNVNLDTVNVSLLIQNALKRKRDKSLDNNDELLSNKRHITEESISDYTEQVLSNLARDQPHLQVGEVTVVDTSSLSSILQGDNQVIVTQLSSNQLAPLTDNIMNNDYGTVVALGLGNDQSDGDNLVVENLIQLNQFNTVQDLNSHSFEQAEEIKSMDEDQITEWQHEE